ncbi:hypothetical protein Ahy_B08g089415 isoform A [Arachis hypogaea]|uniref:Uncharacterized protein n=1 Tax=Arachis hypogaea TaxID=3818 RepID=A0A444XXW2_ARAHY|nr:hypothetical protein Ahy_B08g089415 isoform A [Arachis hypogaea]
MAPLDELLTIHKKTETPRDQTSKNLISPLSLSTKCGAAVGRTTVGEPSTTVWLQWLLLHLPSVPFAPSAAESTASCGNPSLSRAPSRFPGNAAATCFFVVGASSSRSQGKTAARSGAGLAKIGETRRNPPPHLRGS